MRKWERFSESALHMIRQSLENNTVLLPNKREVLQRMISEINLELLRRESALGRDALRTKKPG